MSPKAVYCPISHCHAELEHPRVDYCRDCLCIRPGSMRSQRLGDKAPRLICRHCSQQGRETFLQPLQVGQVQPLVHRWRLNVPDQCPVCDAKNPLLPYTHNGEKLNKLAGTLFWCWPLVVAALFFACPPFILGFVEPLSTSTDFVASLPGWHHLYSVSSSGSLHSEGIEQVIHALSLLGFMALTKLLFFVAVPAAVLWATARRFNLLRLPGVHTNWRRAATALVAVAPQIILLSIIGFMIRSLTKQPGAEAPSPWQSMVLMLPFVIVLEAVVILLASFMAYVLPMVHLASFTADEATDAVWVNLERFGRKVFHFATWATSFLLNGAVLFYVALTGAGWLLHKVYGADVLPYLAVAAIGKWLFELHQTRIDKVNQAYFDRKKADWEKAYSEAQSGVVAPATM